MSRYFLSLWITIVVVTVTSQATAQDTTPNTAQDATQQETEASNVSVTEPTTEDPAIATEEPVRLPNGAETTPTSLPASTPTWFVADNSQIEGPYNDAELLTAYGNQRFSAGAVASKPGSAEWVPIEEVVRVLSGIDDLPPLPNATPPVPTPAATIEKPFTPSDKPPAPALPPANEPLFSSAQKLTQVGLFAWVGASATLMVSPILLLTGLTNDSDVHHIAGLATFGVGTVGAIVGTGMASLGEHQAKKSIGQRDIYGIGQPRGHLSSGGVFIGSLLCTSIVAINSPPVLDRYSFGIYAATIGTTAVVLRGLATIGAYSRVKRYRRLHPGRFHAMPTLTTRYAGLSLGGTF